MSIDEILGWSDVKLSSTLGQPDSRRRGCLWPPPPDAHDQQGVLLTGCLTVTDEGEILDLYPFGMRPEKVQLPVAYEEWRYDDVDGFTWVLYMTQGGVTVPSPPLAWTSLPTAPEQERPLWRRMIGLPTSHPIAHPMSTGRYISPDVLTVSGPLAVAEAVAYPAGTVY